MVEKYTKMLKNCINNGYSTNFSKEAWRCNMEIFQLLKDWMQRKICFSLLKNRHLGWYTNQRVESNELRVIIYKSCVYGTGYKLILLHE